MAGLRGTALGSEPALRFVSLLGELEKKEEKDTAREFDCEDSHSEPEGLDGERKRKRTASESKAQRASRGEEHTHTGTEQRRRQRGQKMEGSTPQERISGSQVRPIASTRFQRYFLAWTRYREAFVTHQTLSRPQDLKTLGTTEPGAKQKHFLTLLCSRSEVGNIHPPVLSPARGNDSQK